MTEKSLDALSSLCTTTVLPILIFDKKNPEINGHVATEDV